jgi:hypothetical protein
MPVVITDSAAQTHSDEGGARAFVRRLYFYGMALISFIAALVATDNLLRILDQIWLGDMSDAALFAVDSYTRDVIAANGGVLLVATPIFLIHWGVVQRRREPEELASGMRKFFLYVAAAVSVGYAVANAYSLLQGIAQLAFGVPLDQTLIWPTGWLHHLLMGVIATLLQLYFLGVAASDGDLGTEEGFAGMWRRLYQCAAGLFGLGLAIFGAVGLVDTLLRLLLGAAGMNLSVSWWRPLVADHLAQALLGFFLLRINWLYWQAIADAHPEEKLSALRRLYLYVAVVMGALTVLLPLSEVVQSTLLALFGYWSWSDTQLLDNVATMIAAIPIGWYVWQWHWRYLQQEAATYGESAQGATIRRIYYYAVALTGLVLVWFGAIDVVQVVIDWTTGQDAIVGGSIWLVPLASGLSRLFIAAPIWAYHWQVSQQVARRDDEAGQAERASAPRKVYLYGVALVGGLVILYYLAQVAYRILLVLLGDPSASFVGAPAGDLARSAIAAVIWIVHFMAIRTDAKMGAEPVAEKAAPVAIDEQRAILEARINLLEKELADARAALAALSQE